MSAQVCRACKRSSRQPTDTNASPTKSNANEADAPGEDAGRPEETITVNPQNDNEVHKTPAKEFISPEPMNTGKEYISVKTINIS